MILDTYQLVAMVSLKYQRNNDKYTSGQLLIEVLVAIGIVVTVLVGVSSLASSTSKLARYSTFRENALNTIQSEFRRCEIQSFDNPYLFFNDLGDGGDLACVHCSQGTDPCELSVIAGNQVNGLISEGSITINIKSKDSNFEVSQSKVFNRDVYQ